MSVSLPQEALDFSRYDRVLMVACGTAYYSCVTAKYWIEELAGHLLNRFHYAWDWRWQRRLWWDRYWRSRVRATEQLFEGRTVVIVARAS